MLRRRFQSDRKAQRFLLTRPIGVDAAHDEAPFCEGSSLVESHDPEISSALERLTVADQDAVAGGQRCGIHDDEGDRQPQRVRAGDHQNRDGALDDECDLAPRRSPTRRRGGPGSNCYQRQPVCGTVRQRLKAAARRLGLMHEPHHLAQGGPLAGAGDLDPQRALAVNRSRYDLIASLLRDRARLAGQERLIHTRCAIPDHAVHRHLFPRPHQDHVALAQLRNRHVLSAAVGDPMRNRWYQ